MQTRKLGDTWRGGSADHDRSTASSSEVRKRLTTLARPEQKSILQRAQPQASHFHGGKL